MCRRTSSANHHEFIFPQELCLLGRQFPIPLYVGGSHTPWQPSLKQIRSKLRKENWRNFLRNEMGTLWGSRGRAGGRRRGELGRMWDSDCQLNYIRGGRYIEDAWRAQARTNKTPHGSVACQLPLPLNDVYDLPIQLFNPCPRRPRLLSQAARESHSYSFCARCNFIVALAISSLSRPRGQNPSQY